MRALLTYATNSSGTQQVAEIIGQVLRAAGHDLTIHRADEPGADDFGAYDFVILGSCTWERFEGKKRLDGQLQQHMYNLVQTMNGQKFPKKKFAVYGLGDTGYTHFCAAADHLEKFVQDLGGELVVPTMRIEGFFFELDKNRQAAENWAKKVAAAIQ